MPRKKRGESAGNSPALLQWLEEGLSKRGKHNLAGLAAALNVHASQVTRILQDRRRIQLEELPKIAQYLETEVPSVVLELFGHARANLRRAASSTLGEPELLPPPVMVEAVIAPGVWRELGVAMALRADWVPASGDPRLMGMRQYGCRIEADGRYAICVDFADLREQRPRAQDLVHVRRTRGEVYEDTLCRVHKHRLKVELRWESGPEGRTHGNTLTYPSSD